VGVNAVVLEPCKAPRRQFRAGHGRPSRTCRRERQRESQWQPAR